MRRGQPIPYTEKFLFVLSFNVAPYFQLKKISFFLFNLIDKVTYFIFAALAEVRNKKEK